MFRVPINPKKDWKAKLERPHFLKVRPGKITVSLSLGRDEIFLLQKQPADLCKSGHEE